MKKLLSLLSVMVLSIALTACGGGAKDGSYVAMDNNPSNGWQTFMTFDVKDGKIANTFIDGYNLQAGNPKSKGTLSKEGKYVLTKPNKGEMDVQYDVISKYIDEHDGLTGTKFNDQGKSDAIAGATIVYSEVPDMIDNAKKHGPITEGKLEDGIYYAKGTKANEQGYIPTLGYLVYKGNIVGANVDAIKGEGDKATYESADSLAGKVTLEGSATKPFEEQTAAISQFMVDNNGLENVEVSEDGFANNIDNVTISIKPYIELFNSAKKVN